MNQFDFIFLYIKIYHLYYKNDLDSDNVFKIAFKFIKQNIKDFMLKLDKNKDLLDKYNYSQRYIDSYKKESSTDFTLSAASLRRKLKNKFNDECFKSVRRYKTLYSGFVISYDDLLNKYKELEYISDKEYITLKNNYGYINYLDCNCDNKLSSNSPKMLTPNFDKQECENKLSNLKGLCVDIKPMKKYITIDNSSIESSDIQDIKQDIQTTIDNMINSCDDKEKLYDLMSIIIKIFKQ